jgi:hypothetical protein
MSVRLIEGVGDLNRNSEGFVELQRLADGRRLSLAGAARWGGADTRGFGLAASARRLDSAGDTRTRPSTLPSRESIGQRFALEVLHDDEVGAAVAADVVQHADVRMLQACDRLRLALEALFHIGAG